MEPVVILIILLMGLPLFLVLAQLIVFVRTGRRPYWPFLGGLAEWVVFLACPLLFFSLCTGNPDGGNDTAILNDEYALSIFALTIINTIAYGYCRFRKGMATPLFELTLNVALVSHLLLYVALGIQMAAWMGAWLAGALPAILLLLMRLAENHRTYIEATNYQPVTSGTVTRLLLCSPWQKYPVLLLLCIPYLLAISLFLMLFGLPANALIATFTETYGHPLSALLCTADTNGAVNSAAVSGHYPLIKLVRIRRGKRILVTRQLHTASAFERLLQERMPHLHLRLRGLYEGMNSRCKRLYQMPGNHWLITVTYVAFLPLEWLFTFILYAAGRKATKPAGTGANN